MKILKKTLGLILAFAMIFTVPAFAAAEPVVNSETVDTLVALGVIVGDENGNLNLSKDITRAEASMMMVRAMGYGDTVSASETVFSDVPASHWASGAIALATQQGILAGYPDGTFKPEQLVRLDEITKIIVAALGYTPKAVANGGFPGGFKVVAAQTGITKGTASDVIASRETVITMLYNALTVPMMEQTGYGTDVTYEVTGNLLLDNLNITKYEGTITSTHTTDTTLKNGYVKIDCDVKYDGAFKTEKVIKVPTEDIDKLYSSVSVDGLVNVPVIMYVKNANEDNAKLLYAIKDKDVTSVKFTAEDLKENMAFAINSDPTATVTIEVYDESTEDYNEYELNITKMYYNGQSTTTLDTIVTTDNSIDITLVSTLEDDVYDIVYVDKYTDYIVDRISARTYKVSGTVGGTLILDEEDKGCRFEIIKNGETISFDDIEVDDVLSVCGHVDGDNKLKTGKVYVISDKVEGKITGKNSDKVYIDGKGYEYSFTVPTIGSTGVFYVNSRGMLIKCDTTATYAGLNYGFAAYFKAYSLDRMDAACVKLLTSEGKWVTLEFADKVVFNNADGTRTNTKDTTFGLTTLIDGSTALYGINNVVAYDLNSEGKINKFYTTDVNDIFDVYTVGANKEYNADTLMFGNIFVEEDVVIFNVDTGIVGVGSLRIDEDQVEVISVNSILDGTTVGVKAYYDCDDAGVAHALLGVAINSGVNYADNFFVVSDDIMETVNADEEEGVLVPGIQGEDKVEIFINSDSYTTELAIGNVLLYTLNDKGEVGSYEVIDSENLPTDKEVGNITYSFDAGRVVAIKSNGNIELANGAVYTFDKNVTGAIVKTALDKVLDAMPGDIEPDSIGEEDGDIVIVKTIGSRIVDFVIITNR